MNTSTCPPAKWIAFWFICVIVFLIAAKCHGALTPEERKIVVQMREEIAFQRDTNLKLETENENVRDLADAATLANTEAMGKLGTAISSMLGLQADLKVADEQVRELTAERNRLAQDLVLSNKRGDEAIARLHKLKNWGGCFCGALAALVALLLVLRWGGVSLNTWGGVAVLAGLPLAAFAVVFSAIWTLF